MKKIVEFQCSCGRKYKEEAAAKECEIRDDIKNRVYGVVFGQDPGWIGEYSEPDEEIEGSSVSWEPSDSASFEEVKEIAHEETLKVVRVTTFKRV